MSAKNKKRICEKCGAEMRFSQILKVDRNYHITFGVMSVEEVLKNEVLETFFECTSCDENTHLEGVRSKLFTIIEK